jgi:hypothetical protein
MNWVNAMVLGSGCTVDGAAETLNPLMNWIEKWSKKEMGKIININTPKKQKL